MSARAYTEFERNRGKGGIERERVSAVGIKEEKVIDRNPNFREVLNWKKVSNLL